MPTNREPAEDRRTPPEVVPGYLSGPDAAVEAARLGLARAEEAESAILVEGITDQIAVETLARRLGRELEEEGVTVIPIGGAQAVARHLELLGPRGDGLDLAGMCDADAVEVYRLGLISAGIGRPETPAHMAELGFFVCVRDLEDELIRAVGLDETLEVIKSEGELRPFHTFQKQPEWRGRPINDQLRRFVQSKASRGHRYADLLSRAVDLERAPAPLLGVLDRV